MILGGIDEAGRGSVMGPLVIAGISLDSEGIKFLQKEGVIDSKKMSPSKREHLYPKIISCAKSVYICRINPKTIDSYVNQNKLNILTFKVREVNIKKIQLWILKIQLNGQILNLNAKKQRFLP